MSDPFDRGGPIRLSWQDRFQNKWPYMTTMMYHNNGGGNTIEPGTLSRGQSVSVENIHRGPPGWPHPQPEPWTDNLKAASDTSSSSSRKKQGCYRACNIALCAFLLITIVTAACAGIGLAILLNSGKNDVSNQESANEVTLLEGFLSPEEEIYMSKKFCDLVKVMMKSTNYPIKEGVSHCYAVLKLVQGSEEMQVEMHVLPADRYTMKEKFRRALREQTLAEGSYRLNGSKHCLKTSDGFPVGTCNGPSRHRTTEPISKLTKQRTINLNDEFVTDHLQPSSTVSDGTILGSITDVSVKASQVLGPFSEEDTGQASVAVSDNAIPSISISPVLMSSTDSSDYLQSPKLIYDASVSTLATSVISSKIFDSSNGKIQDVSAANNVDASAVVVEAENKSSPNFASTKYVEDVISPSPIDRYVTPTLTAQVQQHDLEIVSSSEVHPTLSVSPDASSLSSFATTSPLTPLQSSEVTYRVPSTYTPIYQEATPYLQTHVLASATSDIVPSGFYSQDESVSIATVSENISPSSTLEQITTPSKIWVGKAFQPIAKTVVRIAVPFANTSNEIAETTTEATGIIKETKPKVIENLMLGGVLKLPFKTTSRFRFLFANNSNRQRTSSPVINNVPGAQERLKGPITTTTNYKVMAGRQKAKIRFTPSGSGRVPISGGYSQESSSTSGVSDKGSSQMVVTRMPIPPPIFAKNKRTQQSYARTFNSNELHGRSNRFPMQK